jgi:hypothetical protein
MAKIIKANGDTQEVEPKNGTDFSLKEVQKIVGGYMQLLATKDGKIMVIDEDGKLKQKPKNKEATKLYIYGEHDHIVGDALICEHGQIT